MTITPRRALLPLISTGPHGSRSAMTCLYRCGNACDHPEPNPTDNETMRSLVERAIARRSVLKAGAVAGGALVVGHATGAPAAAAPARDDHQPDRRIVHPGEAQRPRQRHRPGRLRAPRRRRLGRPGGQGRPGVRRTEPDAGGRREAVRLQLRLRRGAPDEQDHGTARREPRVHRRAADVPDRPLRLGDHEADRDGQPRHVRGGDPPPLRLHRRLEARAGLEDALQPPDHRVDPVPRRRPRRGRPAPEDHRRPDREAGPGHAEQLRRRHHALGHRAQRRGELQPVLRQVRRARRPLHRVLRPLRHHRDRQPRLERGRPPVRPDHGAARAVPVRLDRRGRPQRPHGHPSQAHDARTLQARGRQRRPGRQRPGGGLHGRRRARRLHLQVRLPRQDGARRQQRGGAPQPHPSRGTAPSTSPRSTATGSRTAGTTAPAAGSR